MKNGGLVSELRDIQSQLRSAELEQACLCVPVDEDGRVATICFGVAETDAATGRKWVTAALSVPVTMRLLGLWERAGVALQRVPGMGVVSKQWRHVLEMNPYPPFCWSAFLMTGPRLMFCEQMLPGTSFRIQDAARVSADAIDGLIADVVTETDVGHPGQAKIIPATDPEVAEFFRLKQLPGGTERNPIDICREIHAKMNGAKAGSIKRKVNRFLEKHG